MDAHEKGKQQVNEPGLGYEELLERVREAEARREEAEAKASKAQQQRDEAEANASKAQQQREEAEAKASKAQQQREEAEAKASKAQQQRDEAEANAYKEQQLREKAEAKAFQEQQRREKAEAKAFQEQQHHKQIEQSVAPADFHTFLSHCYNSLFLELEIQEDPSLVTTGKFTNVDSKYYPLHLKPWPDFPYLHDQCQTHLESLFKNKTVFPSINGMDSMKDLLIYGEPMADEQDTKQFQYIAVESCARRIIVQYLEERKRQSAEERSTEGQREEDETPPPLRVYFSNTAYGILLADLEDGEETSGGDKQPAYKPAMLEVQRKEMESRGRLMDDGPPPAKRKSSPVRKLHPDQWFMRANTDGSIVPCFVVEYKAAHKLRAGMIRLALSKHKQDLFPAAIREEQRTKIDQDKEIIHATKATARVITQAFHYMVEFGLCYSYVSSGEAMILLYLDENDVHTLYYHLAVPKEDVGPSDQENLRCTSVSLVTTMALLALDGPIMSQGWKKNAQGVLQKWPIPYNDMDLSEKSDEDDEIKNVPLLPAPTLEQTCQDPTKQHGRRRRDDDDGSDQEFPTSRYVQTSTIFQRTYETRSRGKRSEGDGNSSKKTASPSTTSRKRKPAPYCTQACLLGLRNGGLLDHGCPNVHLHQKGNADNRHPLTARQFCQRLRQQLADDLDENCDALDKYGKFGAIGMLFRLTLEEFGYCVVAKGVQRPHASRLLQEEEVYNYLQEQQGQLVPVCLGIIDLVHEYWTTVGAHISHMMLMSYGGEPVFSKAAGPQPENMISLIDEAWYQLRRLGVKHGDEREPNVVWNPELQRIMCIDFEWAKIKRKRKLPSLVSPKRPRLEGVTSDLQTRQTP